MIYKDIIKLHPIAKDLTGMVFGRLTAIAPVDKIKGGVVWLCVCVCGTEKFVRASRLNAQETRSCGCLVTDRVKEAQTTHGRRGAPEYGVWNGMLQRCTNTNNSEYHNYGGRGISVCSRWEKFENFYADMGDRPSKNHSIDRIDNSGNYEPGNCRWATAKEQQRNRKNNRIITYKGKSRCLAEWAERRNMKPDTLWARLDSNWSISRALSEPVKAST